MSIIIPNMHPSLTHIRSTIWQGEKHRNEETRGRKLLTDWTKYNHHLISSGLSTLQNNHFVNSQAASSSTSMVGVFPHHVQEGFPIISSTHTYAVFVATSTATTSKCQMLIINYINFQIASCQCNSEFVIDLFSRTCFTVYIFRTIVLIACI